VQAKRYLGGSWGEALLMQSSKTSAAGHIRSSIPASACCFTLAKAKSFYAPRQLHEKLLRLLAFP
jgi:hypothetical protein